MSTVKTKQPIQMILLMDGAVYIAEVSSLTMNNRRPEIDITRMNSGFREYGAGLWDPGEVVARLVGQVEMHEFKSGSNGWTRLIELGITKSVDQQVRSALASFTSESGKEHLRIKDFVSSALTSLQDDVDKASLALKRQKKRAKRYLSATAYGLARKAKPKKATAKKRRK